MSNLSAVSQLRLVRGLEEGRNILLKRPGCSMRDEIWGRGWLAKPRVTLVGWPLISPVPHKTPFSKPNMPDESEETATEHSHGEIPGLGDDERKKAAEIIQVAQNGEEKHKHRLAALTPSTENIPRASNPAAAKRVRPRRIDKVV
jgi:hypothetical protein